MRHRLKTVKLGRTKEHRDAMLRNLATSILLKGLVDGQFQRQVKTTLHKAKAVRSLVDRLITYAKKGDLSAKRMAARFVKDKEAFKGLFGVLAERYKERKGGYTRILKVSSRRHGDNAEMVVIALVEDEITPRPKKKKKKPEGKAAVSGVAGAEAGEASSADVDEKKSSKRAKPKDTAAEKKPAKSKKASKEEADAPSDAEFVEVKKPAPKASKKAAESVETTEDKTAGTDGDKA